LRRRETSLRIARRTDSMSEVLGAPLVAALCVAADGTFVSDAEGSIVLWNSAAEAILGYTAADAYGRPCCTLLHGDDVDGGSCTSGCAVGGEAATRKPPPSFDMRARSKSGLAVRINVSVLPVVDRRTRAAFIVHFFRDVTVGNEPRALARDGLASASPNGAATGLTRRECEVLGLMGDGLNTATMAKRLHLSRATIRNHVQNILLKLGVHSRLEAVAYGRRHHLL
jgi:PAS domain S-box-containing protein